MNTHISLHEIHSELKRTQLNIGFLKNQHRVLTLPLSAHYDFELLKNTLQQLCSFMDNLKGFEVNVSCVGYRQPVHFWGNAELIEAQEADDSSNHSLQLFFDGELDKIMIEQAIHSCERYAS